MIFLELGNSTIKLARAIGDDTFMLERFASADELLKRLASTDEEVLCAPVGERLSDAVVGALRRRHNVTMITHEMVAPFIAGTYDTPETLGLDRVLNVMGLVSDGIVISCGTAITIDARIAGNPSWGAIMPGLKTAVDGLHARIPALPLVDIERTPKLPARTSMDSVANGVLIGSAGGAYAIAEMLARTAGPRADLEITITGGDAQIMERLWPVGPRPPVVDEMLIFTGMVAANRNR